jgi:VanZ family protein
MLAGLMLFGAVDEWTQPWFGRDLELGDWAADLCGAVTGLGAGLLVFMLARAGMAKSKGMGTSKI